MTSMEANSSHFDKWFALLNPKEFTHKLMLVTREISGGCRKDYNSA